MAEQHVVEQGESIVTIAHAHGFRTGRPIWDSPANAELRARRRDPHILRPGDVVVIPDKGLRTVSCTTSTVNRFVLEQLVRPLRVRAQDAAGVPLDFQPWELDVAGTTLKGETDESGGVEAELPLDAREATLRVGGFGGSGGVSWVLDLDTLDPARDSDDGGVAGVQGRLRNLGLDPGAIDGDAGPRTQEALAMFQSSHGLPATGALDDATVARLERAGGC